MIFIGGQKENNAIQQYTNNSFLCEIYYLFQLIPIFKKSNIIRQIQIQSHLFIFQYFQRIKFKKKYQKSKSKKISHLTDFINKKFYINQLTISVRLYYIIILNKILMNQFLDLNNNKRELVLQLMEMCNIETFDIAIAVLGANNWVLEDSINMVLNDGVFVDPPHVPPPAPAPQPFQPIQRGDSWIQQYQPQLIPSTSEEDMKKIRLAQKKENFELDFPKLGLTSQVSDMRAEKDYLMKNKPQFYRKLIANKLISNNKQIKPQAYQSYFQNLLKNDESYKKKLQISHNSIIYNKKFIDHLMNNLQAKINFNFGNFQSNLITSVLKKKPLLVYIHRQTKKSQNEFFKSIFTNNELTNIVNSQFIIYGMFDNSEDYEILQKTVKFTSLPCFITYSYNKSTNKQFSLGTYSLRRGEINGLIQYLQEMMQKYELNDQQSKQDNEKMIPQQPIINLPQEKKFDNKAINIKQQQDLIYKQLEQEYQLKRNASKLNKQLHQQYQNQRKKIAQFFKNQPSGQEIIQIKFRLPHSGRLHVRNFNQDDKIDLLFKYVYSHCYQEFENESNEFDLVQTFPSISLIKQKGRKINQVFEDSKRQILIIKQI